MQIEASPLDKAKLALEQSIVWDNHGCMPLKADAKFLPQLERYRKAGFTVVAINVGMANISLLEHLRVLSFMRQWIQKHDDQFRLVKTVDDVRLCKADGKLGIVFDVEGMTPVQDNPSFVQTFYELGVRWMLITYNRNNLAGGGCLDDDCGLTAIGRSIIDEMERVGMVLCLSHVGHRTAREAMEYARNPTIFSHSNPYGDTAHPRNVTDELMLACARKGGVIGLNGFECFLGDGEDLVASLIRQMRYAIDLVGPQHVGLSLDYVFDVQEMQDDIVANPGLYPPGAMTSRMIAPESLTAIAEGLARTNLTTDEIGGVLGGNWMRIASAVWK